MPLEFVLIDNLSSGLLINVKERWAAEGQHLAGLVIVRIENMVVGTRKQKVNPPKVAVEKMSLWFCGCKTHDHVSELPG